MPHSAAMTPPVRMTLYSALFFAGFGALIPFLPLWFEKSQGLSGTQIGIILSAAGFGRVILGPMTAAWADGRRDRRAPMLLLGVVAVAAFLLLGRVRGFGALLAVGLVAITAYWCFIPYIEAGLLRLTRGARFGYGVARGIGSALFVVANIGVGKLIDLYGPPAAYWFIVGISALLLFIAFFLAPEKSGHAAGAPPFTARLREGVGLVHIPAFALLIFGAGFIQASHAFYYAFGTLVWVHQGLPAGLTGQLWALGVAVEVVFLMAFGGWSERIRPATLVLVGGLGAVVRWTAFAFEPNIWLLFPLQILHAASFAMTYLGTMRAIQRWFDEARAPTAQMMYAAFAAAPEAALATLLAGPLFDRYGAQGYLGMTGLAAIGVAFAIWLRHTPEPRLTAAFANPVIPANAKIRS